MNIVMIGTGYVGLVTGTCFAEMGHSVTCVDKDKAKIETLKNGGIPIFEPGLEELVSKNVKANRLFFSADMKDSVPLADAVFIAVGTPPSPEDGQADLAFVYAAAAEIARHIGTYTVIVNKSTVPVGTAQKVTDIIKKENPKAEFDVVSNPEFLREGAAIIDFMKPDRVVIGSQSDRAKNVMNGIYAPFSAQKTPIIHMNTPAAEITKYAANAFLALKITFINEIAELCEKAGADVLAVARGIGSDSRIGDKFLQPGPGYGGSCFPKDTLAIARTAGKLFAPLSLVEATISANARRKEKMADKIIDRLGGIKEAKGKTVGILGATFKAQTDDMRDAPSLSIVPILERRGVRVQIYDPEGRKEGEKLLPGAAWTDDPYQALKNADIFVILTEWKEFKDLDFDRIKKDMKGNILLDLRNLLPEEGMKKAGFAYYGIGRAQSS